MLASVVTTNQNTAQVFLLVALIVAIIGTVMAVMERSWPTALLIAAVAFIALGLLFHA